MHLYFQSHTQRSRLYISTSATGKATIQRQHANLPTQLEVRHDDRNLRARDDDNDEDDEQESKQVVELILPDCLRKTDTTPTPHHQLVNSRLT